MSRREQPDLNESPRPEEERHIKKKLMSGRTFLMRWVGIIMKVAGMIGVLLSLVGMIALPFLARWGTDQLGVVIRASAQQLQVTVVSIRFAAQSLGNGAEALQEGQQIVVSIDNSLTTTGPLLESVSTLLADEAPTTLEMTREALISAQASAQAIDRVLRGLDALSPITGVTYQPEKPLEVSLAEVAQALKPLPTAFKSIDVKLKEVDGSLNEMQPVLEGILGELNVLGESMSRLEVNLNSQADTLDTLAARLLEIVPQMPRFMQVVAVLLGLFLFWVLLGLASIYFVGVWVSGSMETFYHQAFQLQTHKIETGPE